MNRRDFVRVCSAGAGFSLVTEALAATASVIKSYRRARLYDASGAPLRAASLTIQRNYVFFYRFQATPCFLLNLGKAVPPAQIKTSGQEYAWPGGGGARRSLVA